MDLSNQRINSNDFHKLEDEIEILFRSISLSNSVEDANIFFKELETIQFFLARAVFKEGAVVNENLRKFVRDFDRLDDSELRSFFFTKLKNKEYSFR